MEGETIRDLKRVRGKHVSESDVGHEGKIEHVSVSEARERFAEILNRALYSDERAIITSTGGHARRSCHWQT